VIDEAKKAALLKRAERVYAHAIAHGEKRLGEIMKHGFTQLADHNNPAFLKAIQKMKRVPVPIDEFVEGDDFLGPQMEVWPKLREDIRRANGDQLVGVEPVNEVLLGGATGWGKALALDTPIPTPTGWAAMGDLKDGDEVYDENGNICRVTKAHPVMLGRPCYRVRFSDGTSIIADGEHRWRTSTRSQRANHSKGRSAGKPWSIVDTETIHRTLDQRHAIPIAGPLEGTDVYDLGIDPYTLGVWLGDGSADSAYVWVSDNDLAIIDQIKRHNSVTKQNYAGGRLAPHTVHGLRKTLDRLGLLGNKHIPPVLMRASFEQRLALLQGLMDSDGTVDKPTGRCTFSNTNEHLARGVLELVRSLGWKPTIRKFNAKLRGVVISPTWDVDWTPSQEPPVFRLQRKREYQGLRSGVKQTSHASWRMVEAVEPIPSVPVRCITVDSPSSLYLAGEAMVPTHNTAFAHVTQAYQLYFLLCFDWPQELFNLSRATPLVFMFSSVSTKVTNRVIYKPFRDMFLNMKFTDRFVEYNKQLEASLNIGQNITVVPALASVQAMVGQAVISGILDEVNFMARVEKSKTVMTPHGSGGLFDQAETTYRNLSRRRKSRFITRGVSPGALCVLSSTRYRGDFLDRRIQEIADTGEKNTLVLRKKQYEVTPEERYTGEKFRLLVGTDRWPTRVLKEHEVPGQHFPVEGEVEMVPIEYLPDFKRDAESAMRDVIGIATDAIRPFIAQRDRIIDAIEMGRTDHLKPFPLPEEVVLAEGDLPSLPDHWRPHNPKALRFIHIDLAVVSDRCGVAMVRHDGYETVRGERLPKFAAELVLAIKPDPQHELQIADLRNWLLRIIERYNLNVVQISFDGFQSRESMQILRKAGVRSVPVSVDRTPEGYEAFRTMLYDGRILLPDHDILKQELLQLEWLAHKNKVDHPPRGGKDCGDAVAGAAFAASKHPMIRAGTHSMDEAGNPLRSAFTMARPKAENRPKGSSRPTSLRQRVRDKQQPQPEEVDEEIEDQGEADPPVAEVPAASPPPVLRERVRPPSSKVPAGTVASK